MLSKTHHEILTALTQLSRLTRITLGKLKVYHDLFIEEKKVYVETIILDISFR